MATKKSSKKNMAGSAEAVESHLQALCSEDDFAGALSVLDRYPQLRTRQISRFERDMRDWGLAYGVAFGLAVSGNPEMAHEAAAELAYMPARRVAARWGVQPQDPGERRENAIRALVDRYESADSRVMMNAQLGPLHDAIADLVESARA